MARSTVLTQIVTILVPIVVLGAICSRDIRGTFSLYRPKRWLALPAAMMLAICLHPTFFWMAAGIQQLYPLSSEAAEQLHPFNVMLTGASLWSVILVIAVTPAIVEELAFRGFILNGLRNGGANWQAVLFSSFLFGITHTILQQSIAAFVVGLMLGYLAIQTRSIFPTMLYHLAHNSLATIPSRMTAETLDNFPPAKLLFELQPTGGAVYTWYAVAVGLLLAIIPLMVFWDVHRLFGGFASRECSSKSPHANLDRC